MEKEVGMETALFGGPPELGNLLKLATGQINFMAIFASPLFEGVADLMPQMWFAATQIKANKSVWQDLIEYEKRKQSLHTVSYREGISPRSRSPAPPAPPPQLGGGSECPSLSEFPSPKSQVGVNPPSNLAHQASRESMSQPGTSIASSVNRSHQESESSDLPYPPTQLGTAARKSSSAIPGVTVMPSASAVQANHGPSNLSQAFDFGLDENPPAEETVRQHDYMDQDVPQVSTGAHQDSPMLAAVIFASQDNSETTANARRRAEIEDVSPYGSPPCGLEHANSSSSNRNYSSHAYSNHHQHQHHISTNTSAPSTLNRNSQANSGATTQSSNTVMTPISPSTQCTSFLSPDTVDEKRGYGGRGHGYGNGYDYDSGNEEDLAYHSESRPTSAGMVPPQMGGSMPAITSSLEQNGHNNNHYSYHHHLKHQHSEETSKNRRFTRPPTSVMGNPNGNGNSNGNGNGNGLGSSHSHGSSVVRVGSGNGSAFGSDVSGSTASRNVPRRRSRLRLAFWRRNKQPTTTTNRVDDW